MATYKNISDDWYITVDGGNGVVYLDGSLDVSGNITYVSEIRVNDAFIAVAANNDGTVTSMGLIATKVANTQFAGLRFNTDTNAWEVSSSVYANGAANASAYSALATSAGTTPGAPNTAIQFNVSNVFTGSANLLFDSGNAKLTLTGHQVFGNLGAAPTAVANSVAIYNNTTSTGGTGLYVKSSTVEQELPSTIRAMAFSLIM